MDEERARRELLNQLQMLSTIKQYTMNATQVIARAAQALGVKQTGQAGPKDDERVLLTAWGQLFREGVVAWGADLEYPNPPHCHLTDRGVTLFANISRDPLNAPGYLAYLASLTTVDPIAQSYIEEALETFRNQCWKATAVMVGGAAERLALVLCAAVKDQLIVANKWGGLNQGTRKDLENYRISRVLDAIQRVINSHNVIDSHTMSMDQALYESYTTYWAPFAGQARLVRNDAGHPKAIAPVGEPNVHAALLTFPLYAKLTADLITWVPIGIV